MTFITQAIMIRINNQMIINKNETFINTIINFFKSVVRDFNNKCSLLRSARNVLSVKK